MIIKKTYTFHLPFGYRLWISFFKVFDVMLYRSIKVKASRAVYTNYIWRLRKRRISIEEARLGIDYILGKQDISSVSNLFIKDNQGKNPERSVAPDA